MNWYEEKQEAKRGRLEDRADRLRREGQARIESGMTRLRAIPFGQPILIGHYSEQRDRNYRRKAIASVDKGVEMQAAAAEAERRAEAIGSGGISSDDPDAVAKLKIQLDNCEREQARMTAINAAWRKVGKPKPDALDAWTKVADIVAMNVNDLALVRKSMATDFLDRPPFTYHLNNNNANIRRIKQRIIKLERNATRETKRTERPDGVKIVQNAEANRLQIIFPGKPPAEHRAILKQYGFRWSPSEGAWQRQLHGHDFQAQWALEAIDKLKG